ncbi:hypothetical protein [Methylomonas sp. DH-1]|uniref:hypothetical protein n=1 Tax=Methylomonas sp. (strain DH-1) TaxID=1727196 RepID=UPI0012F674A8|nr:hypothetical protein [Methylomonas sp. DH-1]
MASSTKRLAAAIATLQGQRKGKTRQQGRNAEQRGRGRVNVGLEVVVHCRHDAPAQTVADLYRQQHREKQRQCDQQTVDVVDKLLHKHKSEMAESPIYTASALSVHAFIDGPPPLALPAVRVR